MNAVKHEDTLCDNGVSKFGPFNNCRKSTDMKENIMHWLGNNSHKIM